MGHRIVEAGALRWRVTNPLGAANASVSGQLGCEDVAIRIWRLTPGQAIPRHRHRHQTEIYLLLEGLGQLHIDGERVCVSPLSAVLVEPGSVRQVFNATDRDALWLIVGAPPEDFPLTAADHERELDWLYPDGVSALPPELGG